MTRSFVNDTRVFIFFKRRGGGGVEMTRARTRSIDDFFGLGPGNGITVFYSHPCYFFDFVVG